jgi:hypothetical protein
LDEHNQEMLFDVAGPHVARALRRCASAVQTLYVPYPADALPYGVCFPMLVDVIEHYDARYQFADPGGQRVTNALAALRCAPRLQHWLLLSSTITQSTNLVPVVLSNALREAVGAERAACRLRLRCCIPAVVQRRRESASHAILCIGCHAWLASLRLATRARALSCRRQAHYFAWQTRPRASAQRPAATEDAPPDYIGLGSARRQAVHTGVRL